jgi:outer membrane protein, heavy metal efflux system
MQKRHSDLRKCERFPVLVAGIVLLSACSLYQPLPLPDQARLSDSIASLSFESPVLHNDRSGRHVFNVTDGIDLDGAGILAVLNNPELKAQRTRLSVAGAQVFAAGLLPDPQLSAGFDRPTGDASGLVNAWSAGLGYDIIPLITRQAQIDAESGAQRQVRLDLLWKEWQVIQQARTLAVDLVLEQQRLDLLQRMLGLYRTRYDQSTLALAQGNITLDINGTDLTALIDVLSQISQLEQTHNQTRHDFNLLLGLQPGVTVRLAPLPVTTPFPREVLDSALTGLAQRRPDLLALKAGYDSQEARVRAAILGQFPSLGIDVHRARDTGAVSSVGLGVTLNLPLLTGNRGTIAIERASRAQLRAEYQARLAQTVVDVDRLRELQDIITRQLSALETYLPRLESLVGRSRSAYAQGNIDALTFLNMQSTWVNKRLEQLSLVQAAWENRIALEALLAMHGFPEQSQSASDETARLKP